MKDVFLKIAAFAFSCNATFASAFSQLEFDTQQQNKEYFNLFYYAISLDPTLATEDTVANYINFVRPTAITSADDEFELHELYDTERKALQQRTSSVHYDTKNILKVALGTYSFEKSSFPLLFWIQRESQPIRRPCVARGLRNFCVDKNKPHGLPSTIRVSFQRDDMPNVISMEPEKAKLLIAPPASRELISNIQFKQAVVVVHNEKHRPLEWEIVLKPKSYRIMSDSNVVLLEKN